jgi:phenylacetate-coenzyme A ligase PaaK-like adenylate-forming protein
MLETGVRQVRMVFGVAMGHRLNTRNLVRLIGDALATIREFGEPGDDAAAVIDGPLADPAARREFATRAMRRTATRLAAKSPFYAQSFATAGVDPKRLNLDGLGAVPVTLKRDLIERADDFQCAGVQRYLATRTTGTTGRPAEIWMSRYEMELWPALGTLADILRGTLRPDDVLHVHVSSRATGAVHLTTTACRLVGASCRVLGIVPADDALDNLAAGGATQMATVTSYLADLEVAARRRGMGPNDFRLRSIAVGGEVLSPSLAQAAREIFGVSTIRNGFSMTEVVPVVGRPCSEGHLHFDPSTGLVEYLDIQTGQPAEPGALATLVVTPYYPYRECMPVFRYDTRDVVRCLAGDLTCDMAGLPGSGHIEGKADQLVRLGATDVVTPRQVVEAIEALPTRPWPARYRATVHDGRLRITMSAATVAGLDEAEVARHFADRGIDTDLAFVSDDEATSLRPLRSDLHETLFAARPALIGA